MPRDGRTFITVHDGMPEHPKVEALSDAAFRALVDLWCWCSRNLTDGRVPAAVWAKRANRRVQRELLASQGGYSPCVEPVEGGVLMHDYLEHQRSAEEIKVLSEKRAAAGAKGGKVQASAKQVLEPMASKAEASSKQAASRTEAETEGLLRNPQRRSKTPSSADADALFEQFWKSYPRKVGKQDARKVWDRKIRQAAPVEIVAGLRRYLPTWADSEQEFIPHPSTWLQRGSWEDELSTADPESVLGRDLWQLPAPPVDVEPGTAAFTEWAQAQRAEHQAQRQAQAREQLERRRGA